LLPHVCASAGATDVPQHGGLHLRPGRRARSDAIRLPPIDQLPTQQKPQCCPTRDQIDVCKRPCVRECCAPVSCNLAQAALLAQGLLGPFACALAYPLEGLHIKSCELHQSQLDWGAEVGAVLSPCPLDPMPIITS